MQFVHAAHDLFYRDTQLIRQVELLLLGVRQELVQWWIEQPDRGRETF